LGDAEAFAAAEAAAVRSRAQFVASVNRAEGFGKAARPVPVAGTTPKIEAPDAAMPPAEAHADAEEVAFAPPEPSVHSPRSENSSPSPRVDVIAAASAPIGMDDAVPLAPLAALDGSAQHVGPIYPVGLGPAASSD
jgi:hypothetical protein